jgi:predicted MFS family arabinose efflux permease
MADVLARPGIALGMVASLLVFGGHFAFFTYVRPFLETVSGAGIAAVSTALLGFGIANLVGTFVAGFLIERSLRATLSAMPLLMAALGSALTVFGGDLAASSVLIAIWGFAFGLVPVAWSTWLTRAAPDQAESAGGLLVAGIQFAIAAGAAAGGAIFDAAGGAAVAAASAAVLLAAAIMIAGGIRSRAPAPARAVAPAE